MNVKYNHKGKELILEETRDNISFLFELLSVCITSKAIKIVLNSKEDLLLYISLSQESN